MKSPINGLTTSYNLDSSLSGLENEIENGHSHEMESSRQNVKLR